MWELEQDAAFFSKGQSAADNNLCVLLAGVCVQMSGGNARYEVLLEAQTSDEGTWLRGPHPEAGFIPFCRDSFEGDMRLRVWRSRGLLQRLVDALMGAGGEGRRGKLVLDASSATGAVESGGGPWEEDVWRSECSVPKLVADTLKQPLDLGTLWRWVRSLAGGE